MKKNIIISGTARAGKSTLSYMLSKGLGYQHVSMDAIIEGFEDIFPQIGIDTHSDSIIDISAKIAPFINAMLISGEYDKFDYGMVIDVCQLMPKDYVKYIDNSICDIYYLITECDTAEERLTILEQYDNKDEYTFNKTYEKKLRICQEIIDESKVFREQCDIYNLPWIDTLNERETKIIEVFQQIQNS